jgi:hypothetical protein
LHHVLLIYGHADTEPPPKTVWCYPDAVDFVIRRPSDPANSRYNPLPHRIPFGVHHSKLFLVGFAHGVLRVIIHTANLRYNDIHIKTQGAFVQDFALKTTATTGTSPTSQTASGGSDFEEALVSYIATY